MLQSVGASGGKNAAMDDSFLATVWDGHNKQDCFVFLDVLMFFILNPSAIESPDSVAMRICRPMEQVIYAVNDLIAKRVLEVEGMLWGEKYVALTSDENVVRNIEGFRKEFLTSRERIVKLFQILNNFKEP